MFNHVKIIERFDFHMVKKSVKIYSMVSTECEVKLSVAFLFLFFSYSNVRGWEEPR